MDAVLVQRIRQTPADLLRVVTYPYKAPDRNKTEYYNPRTGRTNLHESEKNDRYIRYVRLVQYHSLINQRHLTIGSGQGVALNNDAFRETQARLLELTQRGPSQSQIAWIESVWDGFWRRRNFPNYQKPVILIR